MIRRLPIPIVTATVMAVSLMAAPAIASSVEKTPVVQNGKCNSRNAIDYDAKGIEFKCSLAAGGLKWRTTGGTKAKPVAGSGSTSAAVDNSKYANVTGTISADGSSTVAPLTSVAAEDFQKISKTQLKIAISGTGGGYTRLLAGEVDFANASAKYSDANMAALKAKGMDIAELRLATDALTVVVSPRNTWVKCLTVAELKKIWQRGSTVKTWNQVRPEFPKRRIDLFGAGTDSGTFAYFAEVINGKGNHRTDYTPTEDDNVTVNGVRRSTGAMGYYGLSYYLENTDINKAIAIDGGKGCALPNLENVLNGSYTPLARPLFIYVDRAKAKSNKALVPFIEFYEANLKNLANKAKFLPLTPAQTKTLQDELADLKKRSA